MFNNKPKSKSTVDRSNFYTTGQIGRTRETTPEGYLLCRDVPLARIGKLIYGDGEVPVTADSTGLIIIERDEDTLFNPQTIASFEGKPVTDNHPDDWVNPENYKQLSNGTAHDVHRGEGIESDYLMADLLITNKDTIDAVIDGKVEISLGYDADYIEIAAGKGIQNNIFGNHIALVDKGRCGSRCKIGDSFTMANKTKTPWYQAMLGMKRTIDEALEKADETTDSDDETEEDDDKNEKTQTGDAYAKIMQKLNTMDAAIKQLQKTKDSAEPEQQDEDDDESNEQTKDDGDLTDPEKSETLSDSGIQSYTGDSLREVIARAEILSPGYRMPTLDSANNGKAVLAVKRMTLKQAYATADGQKAIVPFIGGNINFDTMPAYTVDAAFIGASELIKHLNNIQGIRSGIKTSDFGRAAPTPADINARNRAFWNQQGK